MRLSAALLCMLLALAGCGNGPSGDDCDKLLTHLIELEINEGGLNGGKADEIRGKLREQAGPNFLKRCMEELPSEQVSCGLRAEQRGTIVQCDPS